MSSMLWYVNITFVRSLKWFIYIISTQKTEAQLVLLGKRAKSNTQIHSKRNKMKWNEMKRKRRRKKKTKNKNVCRDVCVLTYRMKWLLGLFFLSLSLFLANDGIRRKSIKSSMNGMNGSRNNIDVGVSVSVSVGAYTTISIVDFPII